MRTPYAACASPLLFNLTNFLLLVSIFKALYVPCVFTLEAGEDTYAFFVIIALSAWGSSLLDQLLVDLIRSWDVWVFTSGHWFVHKVWNSWIVLNHGEVFNFWILRLLEKSNIQLIIDLNNTLLMRNECQVLRPQLNTSRISVIKSLKIL